MCVFLLIHHPRHFNAVATIARDLKVTHKDAVGDGVLPEAPAEFLHGILQTFSALKPSGVHKQGQLVGVFLGNQVNGSHADGPDFAAPTVAILEQSVGGSSDLRGELCLER
jgi:hypothetical protein